MIVRRAVLAIVLPAFLALAAAQENPPDQALRPLVEEGSFASGAAPAHPQRLRLLSYNLHGPPGHRIEEIAEVLESHPELSQSLILALQEVNRDHEKSANEHIGRLLARRLKMHFAYAAEIVHDEGGGVRGLALLSRFPLSQVTRLQLPVEGPGGRRRITLGATVDVAGRPLRVYTTHLETRISAPERAQQIKGILEDAQRFRHLPTVVLGDFNTFAKEHTSHMFELMQEAGFSCPLDGDENTFQSYIFIRMKLDWIWVRGVEALQAEVEGGVASSDHRPLWVDLKWQ
ncbi:MAG TPA: endonuclease/exonuclease/phosphatase family protein [Acidobacteriota bacterium]|nr:endonuclease/exonuclease/phosphatase family protein [Acidobacteriota bacterium]